MVDCTNPNGQSTPNCVYPGKICNLVPPSIPTVYAEGISYQQQLGFIVQKLNEILDYVDCRVNSIEVDIEEQLNALDQKWMNILESSLADNKAWVEEQLKQFKLEYDQIIFEAVAHINSAIADIYQAIKQGDSATIVYVNSKIQELYDKLKDNCCTMVISPITGKLTPLQEVLNQMMDIFRYFSLTAIEYDSLNLTAEEYDSKELTAFEYDFYGKCKLWNFLPIFRMRDPWTGEIVPVQTVIYKLVDLHRPDAMTAQEYDSHEIEASEFAVCDVTAYEYDWQFKTIYG